jgi:hypothetical protein
LTGEAVKKSIQFFFTSFRRKPESSVFKVLRTYWTPVFTGVTAENQFFHTFGEGKGGGDLWIISQLPAHRGEKKVKRDSQRLGFHKKGGTL